MIKRGLLIGLLGLFLMGCGDQSSQVLGKWSDGAGGSFDFLSDHTLVIKDSAGDQNPVAGKWYPLGDGAIRIDIYTPKGKRIVSMAYIQDDDHLIMELKDKPYGLTREKN